MATETKSCSRKVMSYFNKETITNECKYTAAEKGLSAFHTIKHNHFFRPMDCISSVIRDVSPRNSFLKNWKVLHIV
jgi:hypothetical protein